MNEEQFREMTLRIACLENAQSMFIEDITDSYSEVKVMLERLEESMGNIDFMLRKFDCQTHADRLANVQSSLDTKLNGVNEKLSENISRVNFMLLEMKGVISIIRPNLRSFVEGNGKIECEQNG